MAGEGCHSGCDCRRVGWQRPCVPAFPGRHVRIDGRRSSDWQEGMARSRSMARRILAPTDCSFGSLRTWDRPHHLVVMGTGARLVRRRRRPGASLRMHARRRNHRPQLVREHKRRFTTSGSLNISLGAGVVAGSCEQAPSHVRCNPAQWAPDTLPLAGQPVVTLPLGQMSAVGQGALGGACR